MTAVRPASHSRDSELVWLYVLDILHGKELYRIAVKPGSTPFVFAADERTLAVAEGDGTLVVWELASLKERHSFTPELLRVEVEENVGQSATYEWRG